MLETRVQVGNLDRRITIQEPVYGTNDHNEKPISSWADVATVWAKAEQRQGSEVVDADRVTYYETTVFTIRHRSSLNVTMRIIWDSIPYRIFSITENKSSRKGYMDVTAEIIDNTTVAVGDEAVAFSEAFSTAFNA